MSNHSEHVWGQGNDPFTFIVPFFLRVVPKPDADGYSTFIHLGKDDEDTTFIRHFEDTITRASNVWFEQTPAGINIDRVRVNRDFLSDRRKHGTDDYECGQCTLTGQVWVGCGLIAGGPHYDMVAKEIANILRWRFPMDEMVLATVGVSRDGKTHHPVA